MAANHDMINLDLTAPWHVVALSDAPPVALAVRELQQHWAAMCNRTPALLGHLPRSAALNAIVLVVNDAGGDGFTWRATPDRIEVTGHSPRGLLFGVYHLLEALGCRWLAPGDAWARTPRQTTVALPSAPVTSSPAFAGRCLILGHYAFALEMEAWIEWAARNRFNTIFVHTTPGDFGLGAVPQWAWVRQRDAAMSALHARAMTVEVGGHGLPALLPRARFKEMPLAFREEHGQRTKRHNFCPSSPQAKATVQANARRYFLDNPSADVYHLWADDIPGGGWCSCAACAKLSSSDQLMLATNMVAEVLADVAPQAELSFIAYLDTEVPATRIAPRPNVCLLWAPRTRCYGHAVDDPTCPVNVPYYPATLNAQSARFAEAGTVRVFEYYSDALLFKSVLPILTRVMQQDLRAYRAAGVHTIQTLMTGTHPWTTAQWTNWLFGRLAWDPDGDVDALLADFCDAAFGAAGPAMVDYYRALEQAFALVLEQTPDQRGHFTLPASPVVLLQDPIADMEDPVHATAETLRRRAGDMTKLFAHMDKARAQLDLAQRTDDSPALQTASDHFALMESWLAFCAHRIRMYNAVATEPPAADAREHWEAAQASYARVLAWAGTRLEPLFRENVKGIHFAMWEMRLRRVRADALASAGGKWWIDGGTVVRGASVLGRLIWRYRQAKRHAPATSLTTDSRRSVQK